MQKIKLWDLPTRLFHWLLVAAIAALFVTGKVGGNYMVWHGKLGILVVGLVVFRLVWGFVGSTYARFWQFFPSPARILAYLRGQWHGEGHNPLGALSVFALLTLAGAQATLGLFTTDDIAFSAPLFPLIEAELAGRLTGFHHQLANVLLVFIGLHVASIVFYARVKKNNLLLPMLTGWKNVEQGESARGGGIVALALALTLAALALYAASGQWIPEPPPPPPAEEAPVFNF
ncbi:MAG: cytochrome b/b6 domain-containing protein [Zoogloeaceae bacterium]|nr:cytochrome b/b6 domain-containing protein [Zoogloeaceae bacterium]